jgi:uncharacterized phage protein gp47/JayE
MAILTADDFATQIVAQARVLDPSFSGEIGTPERKIIDAVSQSLADAQVDLTGLSAALDIDSKYGSTLDRFVALFGFQRQTATSATGYAVFQTSSAAIADITISQATLLQCNTSDLQGQFMQYTTSAAGVISQGQTSSSAIPIVCTLAGTAGNCAAGTITQMVGNVPGGVTQVANPNAITNGTDQETDNALKTRFKNTWARNLAGTASQYLALALAGVYTDKANVVGVQSRYQEYIQVPDYDDNGNDNTGTNHAGESTFGVATWWTTAFSDIPYLKQVYSNVSAYVESADQTYYYRPGSDFQFNTSPLIAGDALRNLTSGVIANPATTYTQATTTLPLVSSSGFPTGGGWIYAAFPGAYQIGQYAKYTGISGNSLTGVTWQNTFSGVFGSTPVYLVGSSVAAGQNLLETSPNFTFLNVLTSSDTGIDGLQALAPGDIVLSEFTYISTASRNDINHGVTNAVDLYVNGNNDTAASCIFLSTGPNVFDNNPSDTWYNENFRRDGDSTARPVVGNYITQLFNSPIDQLPPTIIINNQNFYQGVHYWLVHEIGDLGGTIRARDGIEWNVNLGGDTSGDGAPDDPTAPYATTGNTISTIVGSNAPIEVDSYLYDANIVTLQASVETNAQISTDPLVHQATTRYFTLDVTVMYSSTSNPAVVNASIGAAVQTFFNNQYFGAIIQLSDLLDVIHQVTGVDNVRWSNDLPIAPDSIRVLETGSDGTPLHGASVQRIVPGHASAFFASEIQLLTIAGGGSNQGIATNTAFGPTDYYTLTWSDPNLTFPAVVTIPFSYNNAQIQTAIQTVLNSIVTNTSPYWNIQVGVVTHSSINVINPVAGYTIEYSNEQQPVYLPVVQNFITASTYTYDSDYFLLDHELPAVPTATFGAATVPGVIIRSRAQNTWLRPGLG